MLNSYVDRQNAITKYKIQIPKLKKRHQNLLENSSSLSLKLQSIEDPAKLIDLLRSENFSHLKYPLNDEVLILEKNKNTMNQQGHESS